MKKDLNGKLDNFFYNQPEVVDPDMMIEAFSFSVNCAPWPFPDDFKVNYSNSLYTTIFSIINEAKLPKGSLTYTNPIKALQINQQRGEGTTGWFGMSSNEPGQSFGITFDDKVFQIRSSNIMLKDLVFLAKEVFSKITSVWNTEAFSKPALLSERVHTISYSFDLKLRLDKHKVQKTKVKNYTLLSEALSFDKAQKSKGEISTAQAFASLGIEKFIRMDFKQHAVKKIDGHNFDIGLSIEAPFNEENSTLDITSFIRMDDEFGLDLTSGLNWETSLISYFRDIAIKRFMQNLLCSTNFSYR